jgi:hypothetical protein
MVIVAALAGFSFGFATALFVIGLCHAAKSGDARLERGGDRD